MTSTISLLWGKTVLPACGHEPELKPSLVRVMLGELKWAKAQHSGCKYFYIITQVILAFCLVLAYDLLEDSRTIDFIISFYANEVSFFII